MELLSLACGHCGAPLEVPDGTRYVTCGFCASKLEVHRSGGAIYTEVLEALQRRTAEIAEDVEILKLQNELERIDREWQADRESCMIRGKDGRLRKPSAISGFIFLILLIGFAIVWTTMAVLAGTPAALLGLVFLGMMVFRFINNLRLSNEFDAKRQCYEQRRAKVLQAMRNFENTRQKVG